MSNLFGSEVMLADLDLAFGTANINFDQDPPQGIAEAVFSPERLDEVLSRPPAGQVLGASVAARRALDARSRL